MDSLLSTDPTICFCDCHEVQSDLSRSKVVIVDHASPCCSTCFDCGLWVMMGMMDTHKANYCRGNLFDDRKIGVLPDPTPNNLDDSSPPNYLGEI